MKITTTILSCLLLASCATYSPPTAKEAAEVLKSSFAERGIAKLDRVQQSELQQVCSEYATRELPKADRERLEKAALAAIKAPADGQYLGDWKEGERIAQNGRGLQFSDTASTVAGGNCYACHQIQKAEISYGNIGPSLYQYGKLRSGGAAQPPEAIVKYTWGKIWNSHAYNACSNMPRYGAANILTEQQIKHVMALLLDPVSPVNKD
ncbi:MAG: sulfur oxidation c-type cytochrome SoxX [Burkholderiaceae bacterium]